MTIQSYLSARVRSLSAVEQWTWATALLLFSGGDMATTAAGIHLGAVEANPGGVWLIETVGLLPGMILGKTVVIWFAAVGFAVLSSTHRVAVPSALAAVGIVVTAWNAYIISTLV